MRGGQLDILADARRELDVFFEGERARGGVAEGPEWLEITLVGVLCDVARRLNAHLESVDVVADGANEPGQSVALVLPE